MRAYSLDLRERIVAAVAQGMSQAAAARTFRVSAMTVRRYLKRQAAGRLAPTPIPGRRRRIRPGAEAALRAQLAAQPDATLAQHCRAWAARRGQRVSVAPMQRAQRRLGWSRQKRRWPPASATRPPGPPGAPSTRRPTPAATSSSTSAARTSP
jgi:transposase